MKKIIYLLSAIVVCTHATSIAQSAEPDVTFGVNGVVTTNVYNNLDYANDITVLPGGKILVAGSSFRPSSYEMVVERYNADGTVDVSFGDEGTATVEVSTFHTLAKAMAVDADGKIVVVGDYDNDYYTDPIIARFNEDGSVDEEFGDAGFVKLEISAQFDDLNDVAIQPDGKIIAVGSSHKYDTDDFLIMRFNADGTFDESFAADGFLYFDFDEQTDIATSVILQNDDKILVSGYSGIGNTYFAAARFLENGLPDPSFSFDGKMTVTGTGSGSTLDKCYGMALQADSSIILTGTHNAAGDVTYLVARITKYGIPDITFGTGGITKISKGLPGDVATDVIVQADNKILVTGSYNSTALIMRLKSNGIIDNTFDEDGMFVSDGEVEAHALNSLVTLPDNTILTCGYADTEDGLTDYVVMKMTADISTNVNTYTSETSNIHIFPNPATSQISIASDNFETGEVEILISNMHGEIILHKHINNDAEVMNISLPDNLVSGIYSLNMLSSTGVFTSQFEVIK